MKTYDKLSPKEYTKPNINIAQKVLPGIIAKRLFLYSG